MFYKTIVPLFLAGAAIAQNTPVCVTDEGGITCRFGPNASQATEGPIYIGGGDIGIQTSRDAPSTQTFSDAPLTMTSSGLALPTASGADFPETTGSSSGGAMISSSTMSTSSEADTTSSASEPEETSRDDDMPSSASAESTSGSTGGAAAMVTQAPMALGAAAIMALAAL